MKIRKEVNWICFLSSVSSCRNDKCSKKDSCLRYAIDNNIKSETYLVLTEEECNKSKSYINKDEYYKKMIMNIIDEVPNDDLEKKMLLHSNNDKYQKKLFKILWNRKISNVHSSFSKR